MISTIFCGFDHMDIADIALGQLRAEIGGIYDITYTNNGGGRDVQTDSYSPVAGLLTGMSYGYQSVVGMTPPRPVSIKITCDEEVKDRVIARLINLRAHKIASL